VRKHEGIRILEKSRAQWEAKRCQKILQSRLLEETTGASCRGCEVGWADRVGLAGGANNQQGGAVPPHDLASLRLQNCRLHNL